jgi:hypothetical protein
MRMGTTTIATSTDTRDDIRRVAEGVAGVQQQLTLLARRLEKKGVI